MTLTKPIFIRIGPVFLSIIAAFLAFATRLHAEKTFAERLGWKAGDVVVLADLKALTDPRVKKLTDSRLRHHPDDVEGAQGSRKNAMPIE